MAVAVPVPVVYSAAGQAAGAGWGRPRPTGQLPTRSARRGTGAGAAPMAPVAALAAGGGLSRLAPVRTGLSSAAGHIVGCAAGSLLARPGKPFGSTAYGDS